MTMTVKALVERLKSYPQDAKIVIDAHNFNVAHDMTQLSWCEGNKHKEQGVYFE